jgi:hypothetical protein
MGVVGPSGAHQNSHEHIRRRVVQQRLLYLYSLLEWIQLVIGRLESSSPAIYSSWQSLLHSIFLVHWSVSQVLQSQIGLRCGEVWRVYYFLERIGPKNLKCLFVPGFLILTKEKIKLFLALPFKASQHGWWMMGQATYSKSHNQLV